MAATSPSKPRIKYKPEEVPLLARLMRAEDEGGGSQGMLNVGNTMVNRVVAGNDASAAEDCSDFKGVTSITQMVYQKPGGFDAVNHSYFYQAARPDDIELAQQVIDGGRYWPGKYSLWFEKPSTSVPVGSPNYCPKSWYNQPVAGELLSLCYFEPKAGFCPAVYT